jgi:hypothetical protein
VFPQKVPCGGGDALAPPSVELIVSLLAQGVTVDDILDDYPALEPDDVRACLAYAHAVIAHDSLDAVAVEAG